jgi:hypothetical protein
MDFVLASVPWIITWNLDMKKAEKIGLCLTMSLVSSHFARTLPLRPQYGNTLTDYCRE